MPTRKSVSLPVVFHTILQQNPGAVINHTQNSQLSTFCSRHNAFPLFSANFPTADDAEVSGATPFSGLYKKS